MQLTDRHCHGSFVVNASRAKMRCRRREPYKPRRLHVLEANLRYTLSRAMLRAPSREVCIHFCPLHRAHLVRTVYAASSAIGRASPPPPASLS
jgi:hypothetical protein